MSKLFPTNGFTRIDPKDFDLNEYTNNSSEGCVLKVDPKELFEVLNNCLLAPD